MPDLDSATQFWYFIPIKCKRLSTSNTGMHKGLYTA